MTDNPINKAKREKIVPAILAAIVNDNKILLLHRTKKPYQGYWGLIGGKIEFGEHVEDTALREVFEETGLRCKIEAIKGIATELLHTDHETENHFIFFIIQLTPETIEVVESDEGKLGWFRFDELDKIKITPSDSIMIKEFILKKNNMKVHKIKVKRDGENYDVEEFV